MEAERGKVGVKQGDRRKVGSGGGDDYIFEVHSNSGVTSGEKAAFTQAVNPQPRPRRSQSSGSGERPLELRETTGPNCFLSRDTQTRLHV